jgi:hypothetical protein
MPNIGPNGRIFILEKSFRAVITRGEYVNLFFKHQLLKEGTVPRSYSVRLHKATLCGMFRFVVLPSSTYLFTVGVEGFCDLI